MTVLLYLSATLSVTAGIVARCTKDRFRPVHLAVRLALTVLGAVALFAAVLGFDASLSTLTEDTAAWAADALHLWMRVCGITSAVLALTFLLCAVTRHRWHNARALAAAAGTWLTAIVGHAYAVICTTETVALAGRVVLFSVGCILLLGAGECVDRFTAPPEKKKKKKKRL